MANIFSRGSEGRIFKDERALQPQYLPDVLPHREREITEIADALRGAAHGGRPENVLLTGPTGTGKTSCAKYVLKELEEYTQRTVTLYVNCWEMGTRHGILSMLANALEVVTPRRGVATDEIIASLSEALTKGERGVVIVLDEVDRLFAAKYDEWKVLYDLSRSNELFAARIGIISITNNEGLLVEMDQRVKSSLVQRHVRFKSYSPVELKDILRERAKMAFMPDALDSEAIPLCAGVAAKRGGDARLALNVLWRAGKLAEAANARKVEVEHVKRVREDLELEKPVREELEPRLEGLQKRIFDAVKKKGEITSGELYKLFGENERTVEEHVSRLEKLGIVEAKLLETKAEKGGMRGKTRLIKIKRK